MPKISVIVPVYNSEKSLSRCIESILRQSYRDFEVIVINDGSKDNSINIITEYLKNDDRIVFINNENKGVSETRNIGIEKARGEYIIFIDSDDYIDKEMFKNILEDVEKYKADMVVTGIIIDIENMNHIKSEVQTFQYENTHGKRNIAEAVLKRLDGAYIHSLWNKIFKRDIIIKNNIKMNKNISLGEDLIFNLEYLKYCENVIFDDRAYYHYFMNTEESLTTKYRHDKLELMKLLYDKCMEYFEYCEVDSKASAGLNNIFIKWMYSCFIDLNNKKCTLTTKEKIKYITDSRKKYIQIINQTNELGVLLLILKISLKYPYIVLGISKIIYLIKTRFRQILYK